MFSRARLSLLLPLAAATLLVGGCASPSRVAVPKEQLSNLAPATGVVAMKRQEIGTTINRSNVSAATGGGLIFALVDAGINNSRAKKAEAAATPIRDALVNYQPTEVLAKALTEKLTAGSPLPVGKVEVVQIKDTSTVANWIKAHNQITVLVLDADYVLTPQLNGIRVSARVSLHPATGKAAASATPARDLPPALYFNHFSSEHLFPAAGIANPEEAAKLWAADGGEVGRTLLDRALGEIVDLVVYDLTQPARPENGMYKAPPGTSIQNVPTIQTGGAVYMGGYVEREADGRRWIRVVSGELHALPSFAK